ncbi:protein TolR [Saccharospirillum mangrovi]|uniref:protein TolR n=1 Tax=Saccharospirillum mangrovi TaxID=2161747 RepID=UPI000D3B5958|nr:protein TolR [Saccharospirillum mangrovi]
MSSLVRKRRKPMSEINVVPYIDVMLVLLIIFMVTAPMMMQGVEVDVPQVESGPLERDENQEYLIVAIDAQGQVYVERGEEAPEVVEPSGVGQYVSRVLGQQPSLQVYIRGDTNITYGRVMQVMSNLQAAGVESVGLITEAPDEQ